MPCGCQSTTLTIDRRPILASRALSCAVCAGFDATHCPSTGRACAEHIEIGVCPRKAYGERGVVRWLGLDWYGVPYLKRRWVWFRHFRQTRSFREFNAALPGCGCLRRLKDVAARLSPASS